MKTLFFAITFVLSITINTQELKKQCLVQYIFTE
jgi:hypothetical protein